MGLCQSIYYEDEDDKARRLQNEQAKRDLKEFHRQLHLQKGFSELDVSGKGISRKHKQKQEPTPEQVRVASNIIYDA